MDIGSPINRALKALNKKLRSVAPEGGGKGKSNYSPTVQEWWATMEGDRLVHLYELQAQAGAGVSDSVCVCVCVCVRERGDDGL